MRRNKENFKQAPPVADEEKLEICAVKRSNENGSEQCDYFTRVLVLMRSEKGDYVSRGKGESHLLRNSHTTRSASYCSFSLCNLQTSSLCHRQRSPVNPPAFFASFFQKKEEATLPAAKKPTKEKTSTIHNPTNTTKEKLSTMYKPNKTPAKENPTKEEQGGKSALLLGLYL